MPNSQETRYFKIGLFVLIALALLVGLILLFSTSGLFKRHVLIETYFNESVQGLSVGSPVKYRGIDVGEVKAIELVNHIYHFPPASNNAGRYIYVLISISSSFLTDIPPELLKPGMENQVRQGLRIKLALQDLSGNVYLEMNYVNPKQNPPLPIFWQPENLYIPSAVSVLTRFSDSVQNLLQGLQTINFPQFFNNANHMMTSTEVAMKSATQTMKIADKTLENTNLAINNANQTVSHVNNILQLSGADVVNAVQNASILTNDMRQLVGQLKGNPSQLIFGRPQPIDPGKL